MLGRRRLANARPAVQNEQFGLHRPLGANVGSAQPDEVHELLLLVVQVDSGSQLGELVAFFLLQCRLRSLLACGALFGPQRGCALPGAKAILQLCGIKRHVCERLCVCVRVQADPGVDVLLHDADHVVATRDPCADASLVKVRLSLAVVAHELAEALHPSARLVRAEQDVVPEALGVV